MEKFLISLLIFIIFLSSSINADTTFYDSSDYFISNNISATPYTPTNPGGIDFSCPIMYIIPAILIIAVLIGGGVVFAIGYNNRDFRIIIVSFIVVTLGLVSIQTIVESLSLTCG